MALWATRRALKSKQHHCFNRIAEARRIQGCAGPLFAFSAPCQVRLGHTKGVQYGLGRVLRFPVVADNHIRKGAVNGRALFI